MALVPCRECGRDISSEAPVCPHCGIRALVNQFPKPSHAAPVTAPRATPTPAPGWTAPLSRAITAPGPVGAPRGGATPPYVEARLLPGERAVYRPYLAPLSMVALPILFAFATLVTLFVWLPLALIFFLMTVATVAGQRLRYVNTEFSLTDRRILVKVGWLSHRSSEVLLSKVESINVVQGFDGRMLGYGSIAVTGTGGSHEVIESIDKPFEFIGTSKSNWR